MSAFFGVVYYEYRMAIRRWGLWLAFGLSGLPFALRFAELDAQTVRAANLSLAGAVALSLNFMMPVVAGIVIADRLTRDRQLGTWELLAATPLSRQGYVLGKYAGAVLATLTPVLATLLLVAGLLVGRGAAPTLLLQALVAFLAINVPAHLFVAAFSLACPALLPVRVYQVLYTGYWFWGNFLNPKAIPTLAGTLLTPGGQFVAGAFFQASFGDPAASAGYTPLQAGLNVAVLLACAAGALAALERYLAWQDRRA